MYVCVCMCIVFVDICVSVYFCNFKQSAKKYELTNGERKFFFLPVFFSQCKHERIPVTVLFFTHVVFTLRLFFSSSSLLSTLFQCANSFFILDRRSTRTLYSDGQRVYGKRIERLVWYVDTYTQLYLQHIS